MATYKVIQDIEAEDKLLGPLSLRQFIFAIIAVLCFYFCYLVLSKHAAIFVLLFLPPGLFAAFFAIPFGIDQPTEVWALAKIRFLFKPRRRIWDQSGVKELVTITVPKKVEEVRTNGLSQTEVKSRLSALANTIDSHGWSIKNMNVSTYSQSRSALQNSSGSDRLIDLSGLPQEVPSTDVQASDDILDEQNNPIAHQFDQMINASTQAHHQQIMTMMQQPTPAASQQATQAQQASVSQAVNAGSQADYWFLNQPTGQSKSPQGQVTFNAPQSVSSVMSTGAGGIVQAAEPTAEEEAIGEHIKEEHARPNNAYAHLKTIQPLDAQSPLPSAQPIIQSITPSEPVQPVTPQPNPAIIELANNNDLNVATIARQAHKAQGEPLDEDEVVISLH
jgi:hypothetical protein